MLLFTNLIVWVEKYNKHLTTASTISCLISTTNTVNSLILHEVYRLKMICSTSFFSRVEYSRVCIIHYFLQSHNRFWGNVMFLHMSVILFASWHRSGQYACDSNTFLLKLQIIRNQCIFFCTYFQSLHMWKRYL